MQHLRSTAPQSISLLNAKVELATITMTRRVGLRLARAEQQQTTIPHSKRYLQVFFVVVVHNSQEERHEDVGVDDDKGNEEEGVPGAEVECWHPREGERGCFVPGRQTGK